MSVLTAHPIAIEMPSNPMQSSSTVDDKDNINLPQSSSSTTGGWGSYLYQNLILPALTPNTAAVSEWLNLNTPLGYLTPHNENTSSTTITSKDQSNNSQSTSGGALDYFGGDWNKDVANLLVNGQSQSQFNSQQQQQQQQQQLNIQMAIHQSYPSRSQSLPVPALSIPQYQHHQHQAGPSQYFSQPYFFDNTNNNNQSISTSLLFNAIAGSSNSNTHSNYDYNSNSKSINQTQPSLITRSSVDAVDNTLQVTHSPSPMTTAENTPQMSPKRRNKRRLASMDEEDNVSHGSDGEQEHEHESEVPEGVERDGMIWGMKVESYRALSARERKRVRNRISARTFRAKRKEHLNSLEENMTAKDLQLKLAMEETNRLRQEVKELKYRLALYEVA